MNTSVTMFDDTGRITLVVDVTPETLPLYMVMPGSKLVGVRGDPAIQYVDALSLVEYTEAERVALAALKPGWVWQMPEKVAVDMRAIADIRATAIAAIDKCADAARLRVVGDAARIEEYKQALASAQAFKDSGYTLDPVPEDVECWTTPTRTAQESADAIIAKSVEWYGALGAIRSLRLRAKTSIDLAATNAAVDSALATFTATLTAAMQGVQ